jgi:hypothetical protein
MNIARFRRALVLSAMAGGAAIGVMIAQPAVAGAATSQADSPSTVVSTQAATIVLDSSQAPDLAGWLQNRVAPTLHTWYPRIQSTLGGAAPDRFTVRILSSYSGVAYVTGTTIHLGANYFRSHQSDIGATVHEAVHIAQQYRGMASWSTEGVADWYRFYQYHGTGVPKPPASANYNGSYRITAYYYEYIRSRYDSNFLRKMHTAGKAGGPSAETVIQQSTGKSAQAVWDEMQRS